ncbi:beta-ribofuranosylaminobenzene 5'-phosphate synthase family protein [Paludisphaera rhizosphaerae]|uniref:beta-ribofuranosylaminobenzene 5'-phosphate synthase family protein n=1 Tax=Paludisphaera rhizosphaerae TaxID=2711216 RepID=UPI0013ED5FD4|nr:beta-ribofuranosylaminobenzene 5'-phosphate synthase family protein [Paludisphaera rhizosphaerae]
MRRLTIRTGSRLHFGLLGWGPHLRRQFGGVGLMVEEPGLEMSAVPADRFEAVGPLADRVGPLLERIAARWDGPTPLQPVRVEVLKTPDEHAGFGVGTQLSLAVARLVLETAGEASPPAERLAALSGRGRRSGVGLHGFVHGGLIVDAGHAAPDDLPPMVSRLEFPAEWSILIVRPPAPPGRHGGDEVAAFADLPPVPEAVSGRLCRLVLLDLLGAVAARDLPAFGEALTAIQREVGAAFAPAQGGGVYASPESEALVAKLGRLGLFGAGQSSWGPSLYAFGILSDAEKQAVAARLGLPSEALFWTHARNQGAVLTTDS